MVRPEIPSVKPGDSLAPPLPAFEITARACPQKAGRLPISLPGCGRSWLVTASALPTRAAESHLVPVITGRNYGCASPTLLALARRSCYPEAAY